MIEGEDPPSNIRRRRRAVWKELEDTFFAERPSEEPCAARHGPFAGNFPRQLSLHFDERFSCEAQACAVTFKLVPCVSLLTKKQQSAPGAGGVNPEWTLQIIGCMNTTTIPPRKNSSEDSPWLSKVRAIATWHHPVTDFKMPSAMLCSRSRT